MEPANTPPVGFVNPQNDSDTARKAWVHNPHLVYAGKAKHSRFEVPSVSPHAHERIDPREVVATVRPAGEPKPDKGTTT
jgi:adenine-specific DNA-methyltransferase